MNKKRILHLADNKELIKIIQYKEKKLHNLLLKGEIKKHLRRIDNIVISAIKEIEIRKGHNPYKHGLALVSRAREIAKKLKCCEDEIELTACAAYLHDIGKSKISKAILNKPSQLTPEEYKRIQHHVIFGKEIVLPFTWIGNIIKYHHERCDGNGYLEKLKEEDIPLGSKILSVVDAYNAITHLRVYDPQHPKDFAINELKRCACMEFDKQYVEYYQLNILSQLREKCLNEEYKKELLVILSKRGEFTLNEINSLDISKLEKLYLETRLRYEKQFDSKVVEAFLSIY